MKKASKKILQKLPLVLMALLLGLSAYSWNAKTVLGNQMPMPLGIGMSVVLSGSMEPAVSPGDLVIVRKSGDIRSGDIVVYQSGATLVLHRVVEVNGQELITQGDANNAPDPAISLDQVKGELVAVLPHLGTLARFFQRPAVLLTTLAVLALLVERSYRKERQEKEADLQLLEEEIRKLSKEIKENYKR